MWKLFLLLTITECCYGMVKPMAHVVPVSSGLKQNADPVPEDVMEMKMSDAVADVNQCENGENKCSKWDFCFNRDDSLSDHVHHPDALDHSAESHKYSCYSRCPAPYYRSVGKRTCVDVDECAEKIDHCSRNPNYKCVNVPGGYTCKRFRCNEGFVLNKQLTCDDKDECLEDPQICGAGGHCTNTHGAYNCYCRRGYKWNGTIKKCEDYNECSVNNGYCHHMCTNSLGSYKCSCPKGYTISPNGYWCRDTDECTQNPSICADGEQCVNTYGSYMCLRTGGCTKHYERISSNKCKKKACTQGDMECSKLIVDSYAWAAFKFYKNMRPRQFSFTYKISGFSHDFTTKFSLAKGNDNGDFKIERRQYGFQDVAIVSNQKAIEGPKLIQLVLHADLIRQHVVIYRYVYTLYLDLGHYNFG